MWLLQLFCFAVVGALPCHQFPGQTTTFISRADFSTEDECNKIGIAVARRDHFETGNDYGYKCVFTNYTPRKVD